MQQFSDVTTNLRKEKEAQVADDDHEEAYVSLTSIIKSIHDTDGPPLQRNLQGKIFLSPAWMAKRHYTRGWPYQNMSFFNDDRKKVAAKLVKGVQEMSQEILECVKPLPKKPTTNTSTYMDKGKSNVESISPPPTSSTVSTLTAIQHILTDQHAMEKPTSSSTSMINPNETQQSDDKCNKVYQPKYPSFKAQQRRNQTGSSAQTYGTCISIMCG